MPAVDSWSLFGQFLGLVAVVLGFLTYQMRTPRQLLLIQAVTCIVFCAHYFLIGATSGLVLNAVGVVRNIVYYNRDKKLFSGAYVPYVFALIMLVLGIFTWQSWYSLLVIVGLAINTVCMSLQDAQKMTEEQTEDAKEQRKRMVNGTISKYPPV